MLPNYRKIVAASTTPLQRPIRPSARGFGIRYQFEHRIQKRTPIVVTQVGQYSIPEIGLSSRGPPQCLQVLRFACSKLYGFNNPAMLAGALRRSWGPSGRLSCLLGGSANP